MSDESKSGDHDHKVITFQQSQCHEPEIVLLAQGHWALHDQLTDEQLMNRNKLLFEMYDIWKPKALRSNCGETHKKHDSWHWVFGFELDAFERLFIEFIHVEKIKKRQQILQTQWKHVLNTHNEWKAVKLRDELQQIEHDYKLYETVMRYNDNSLPTKQELLQHQEMRRPIKIDGTIKFGHPHSLSPFNANCTRLFIEIPTKVEKSEFKMTHYEPKLNQALETLTDLVTNSADIIKGYVAGKVYDIKEYSQSLNWFQLGITTNHALNEAEDSDSVIIIVHAQLSIFHYIFLLIQKYEHKQIQEWIKQYMKNLNDKLSENGPERVVCECNNHTVIEYELKAKKMKNYVCIGRGYKNYERVTLRYKQTGGRVEYNKEYQRRKAENDRRRMKRNVYRPPELRERDRFGVNGSNKLQNKRNRSNDVDRITDTLSSLSMNTTYRAGGRKKERRIEASKKSAMKKCWRRQE